MLCDRLGELEIGLNAIGVDSRTMQAATLEQLEQLKAGNSLLSHRIHSRLDVFTLFLM